MRNHNRTPETPLRKPISSYEQPAEMMTARFAQKNDLENNSDRQEIKPQRPLESTEWPTIPMTHKDISPQQH